MCAVLAIVGILNTFAEVNSDRRKLWFLEDWLDDLDWRNELFQVASGLIFLAWTQWYPFLFRLLLISGEICYIVWSWEYPNVELDTVIWNGVCILINLFHLCIFLLSCIKPSLSQKEQEIYNEDFHLFFTIADFKRLMKHAEIEIIRSPRTIQKQKERISHLYYCHVITKGATCSLLHKGEKIHSVHSSHWVGIYDSYHSLFSGRNIPSEISSEIKFEQPRSHAEFVRFNLETLQTYLAKKGIAQRVRKSLMAYWFHKRSQNLTEVSTIVSKTHSFRDHEIQITFYRIKR